MVDVTANGLTGIGQWADLIEVSLSNCSWSVQISELSLGRCPAPKYAGLMINSDIRGVQVVSIAWLLRRTANPLVPQTPLRDMSQ